MPLASSREVYPIPAPHDLDRAYAADGPIRIAYAGRLTEGQKRVSRLVELARELERRHVAYVLTIAGDGPDEGRMREDIAANGPSRVLATNTWATILCA